MGNWINIGGFIGTALGVVLSIYFYRRSIQRPIPTFAIDPLRVRIVDKSNASVSGLEVLHNGHPVNDKNVTATTVYFWNDGRLPLRRTDVLTPYSLWLNEDCEILDCRVVKISRAVCNPHVENVGIQVKLAFDVLEDIDAVAVQVIHAGVPETGIEFGGVAVGAATPKRFAANHRRDNLLHIAFSAVMLLVYSVVVVWIDLGTHVFSKTGVLGVPLIGVSGALCVYPVYRWGKTEGKLPDRVRRRLSLVP
jgi:hypothetical protein